MLGFDPTRYIHVQNIGWPVKKVIFAKDGLHCNRRCLLITMICYYTKCLGKALVEILLKKCTLICSYKVKLGDKVSNEEITSLTGVKQGCSLSPFLSNI